MCKTRAEALCNIYTVAGVIETKNEKDSFYVNCLAKNTPIRENDPFCGRLDAKKIKMLDSTGKKWDRKDDPYKEKEKKKPSEPN